MGTPGVGAMRNVQLWAGPCWESRCCAGSSGLRWGGKQLVQKKNKKGHIVPCVTAHLPRKSCLGNVAQPTAGSGGCPQQLGCVASPCLLGCCAGTGILPARLGLHIPRVPSLQEGCWLADPGRGVAGRSCCHSLSPAQLGVTTAPSCPTFPSQPWGRWNGAVPTGLQPSVGSRGRYGGGPDPWALLAAGRPRGCFMESLLSLTRCWGCCRLAGPRPSDALCPPDALDAVCLLPCLQLLPPSQGG